MLTCFSHVCPWRFSRQDYWGGLPCAHPGDLPNPEIEPTPLGTPLPCHPPAKWLSGKESTCRCRRHGFNPWVRKIPWRRKFLPGKSHAQGSLVGYSPWGCRVGHHLATKRQQFVCWSRCDRTPQTGWLKLQEGVYFLTVLKAASPASGQQQDLAAWLTDGHLLTVSSCDLSSVRQHPRCLGLV